MASSHSPTSCRESNTVSFVLLNVHLNSIEFSFSDRISHPLGVFAEPRGIPLADILPWSVCCRYVIRTVNVYMLSKLNYSSCMNPYQMHFYSSPILHRHFCKLPCRPMGRQVLPCLLPPTIPNPNRGHSECSLPRCQVRNASFNS